MTPSLDSSFVIGLIDRLRDRDCGMLSLGRMGQRNAHPVNPASLPGGIKYPADRRLQACVRIRDYPLEPAQTPGLQTAQKLGPERFRLGRAEWLNR